MVEWLEGAKFRLGGRGLTHCERDWRWTPPPLRDYDLWVVLQGRGRLRVNTKDYALLPGSSFLLQPGSHLHGEHDPSHRLFVFYCHFDWRMRTGETPRDTSWTRQGGESVILRDLVLVEALARVVIGGAEGVGPGLPEAHLALKQILLHRVRSAQQAGAATTDERIARVLWALQAEPERKWTQATMAQTAGLSITQFRRLFAHATGLAPNAYLVRGRIARARVLLEESPLPLSVLADNLGYRDVYYFCRQFKQWTGQAPGAYRKACRNRGDGGAALP